MTAKRYSPTDMLAELVRFDTTSRESNLDLIRFVEDYLNGYGISSHLVYDEEGGKANLVATVGPDALNGIVLSGHSDVVPVDGQTWNTNPFEMVEKDGLLYGRGTCDMKGYIATALALVPEFLAANLKTPCLGWRPKSERDTGRAATSSPTGRRPCTARTSRLRCGMVVSWRWRWRRVTCFTFQSSGGIGALPRDGLWCCGRR